MKTVKNKSKFYCGKSLYWIEARGKSKVKQKPDSKYALLEERIILIKAKNFNEAIKKARKEAKDYEGNYINPYGQQVRIEFLECIEVFELFESPADLVEVFSANFLVDQKISKKEMLNSHYGKSISETTERKIRSKFLNGEFASFKK
ncbi:DUF4288 domain-containing protein [Peredibacter starrii]|uniref:DUF4288 domain-containing protein n=1 Tax=Peredibacter starrii TaxID=28202 RepID=A0AAX4HP83_9BACT|nr:DUF4288 domain-containing protein [Peredibacter starrii]WPU65121.1 DUF4288 domain-containing protein [Peredibacter starrii]